MAAVGGLFCAVSGSSEVSKSMYNDARRLVLASFNRRNILGDVSATSEDKLMTVKTVRDTCSLSTFIDRNSLFSLLSMDYAVVTKGATNLPRLFTPT
ncbi:uncharacterized protein A1O5_00406 [Cladophialophora psammophila CBS 110553]|uniref:Uncharacterized protein n=1 Tax=Cladophialophora psammophila CBS 110553 TaxID=1182543 RepID=W9X6T0_9EURO|nr:uncharacterized protein A1O5_00406 [Cladophialophora psammophila CBS 110553]EXJ75898.1 hypothetical protein A1O5_00406 [Cladophialophora psammophila CBS 110553]